MPRWMYQLALRFRSLFLRRRVESELDEELRLHFEQLVRLSRERGVPLEDARRQASLELGGFEQQKEKCRDTRGLAWLDHFARDLAHAVRMLRTNPGFASVAIVSLALGIGANTAIFQLIDAVRLMSDWPGNMLHPRFAALSLRITSCPARSPDMPFSVPRMHEMHGKRTPRRPAPRRVIPRR